MTEKLDWAPLRKEISKWRRNDMVLPVWWRDDDAATVTQALEQLGDLSKEVGVPVHLAIVPRNATQALASWVNDRDHIIPVVHGWAHRNHEPTDIKKSEFGEGRPVAQSLEEAQEALRRMRLMFGEGAKAMFVPPWTHVSDDVVKNLARFGYTSLSTVNPRTAAEAAPGLMQINPHVDPIAWRNDLNLQTQDFLIERTAAMLKDRRKGQADNDEPFGLLTHHLAMKPEHWQFTRQFWFEIFEAPVSIYQSQPT